MPSLAGFVDGAYETQSRVMAGERCVNLFPARVQQGGKVRSALLPTPGFSTFATMTQPNGRGIFAHDGRLFAVFGNTLSELSSAGVETALGTVAVDGNPATFDTNGDAGNELLVSSGGSGYLFTLNTSVFSTPLSSGSTQVGQVDGFFISLNAGTSTWRISDSLDGTTWSALNVAQRTSASDPWIAMMVARGEVYLFGDKTGDVWYNAGLPTFPFAARPEGFFQCGIASAFSLASYMGSVAWLGRTHAGGPGVYVMDGYSPLKISDEALDVLIQQFEDAVGIDDALGWSYSREGHDFYVLSFPSANRTFTYDGAVKKWHERGYWDQAAGDYTEYRGVFHANCFGKNLVCDPVSNRIYALSSTTYTDAGGDELRRMRRTPHTSAENRRNYFGAVELECDRGVGNANAPGEDPLVGLRYSNDGGVTWGDSRTRQIGARGNSTTRVRWENCGSGRDRVWEIWQTDPNPARWFDLYVDAEPGVH